MSVRSAIQRFLRTPRGAANASGRLFFFSVGSRFSLLSLFSLPSLLSLQCFFSLLVVLFIATGCQPTNTVLSKKDQTGSSANPAGAFDPNVLVLRVTDSSQTPFSSSSLAMNVGDTLSLEAGLFRLDNTFVSSANVTWNVRSLSGGTVTGLSCVGVSTSTCNFDPVVPASVVIDVSLSNRPPNVVAAVDTTPTVIVSAPSTPVSLTLSSGDNQIGLAGGNLGLPLVAVVKDAFNRPVGGVAVQFTASLGGGSIVGVSTVNTDASGLAAATAQLGTVVGNDIYEYEASVVSAPTLRVTFSASALPGAVASLELQTAPAASYSILPFSQQPVVVAKDGAGNVVTTLNDPVSVTVQTGNGTLNGNVTKNFINGVVSFTDLAYSLAESGVVFRFSSGGHFVDSGIINFVTPAGVVGTVPNDVNFGFKVTESGGAAGRSTSNAVTIAGLSQAISVSVVGSGSPRLRLNGGSEVSALFNVNNGDTLMVVADAPSAPGANSITITMGGRTETFEVRYADPNVVAYAFVTNNGFAGNQVNNGSCTTYASTAGYGGQWVALAALTTASLKDIMPYRWGVLKRLDGQIIANSWEELWTGPLLMPININEYGGVTNTNVFTGAPNESSVGSTNGNCNNWIDGVALGGILGQSQSTTSLWINNGGSQVCSWAGRIYCVSDPSGLLDTTPKSMKFGQTVVTASGTRHTSNAVTVSGLTTVVTASVGGSSGNPRFTVNGGAEVSSASVQNGDILQLVMDAPSTAGSTNLMSITVGSLTADWPIRFANPANQSVVFVTNGTYSGTSMGGIVGAHAKCQSAATAAGLDGIWTAMITDRSAGDLNNNIPWNWGSLHRMDGAIIANNWDDLWDGTIVNSINLTEYSTVKNTDVWTGVTHYSGTGSVNTNDDVAYWNSGALDKGRIGKSFSTGNQWITDPTTRDGVTSLALYCILDPSATLDTTPTDVNFLKSVSYSSGARVTSNSIDISGVSTSISVSVSGSNGNPQLKINGGAEVTSGTASWGDTIEIVMDAPTVFGDQYTATVVLGSRVKTWSLGYADSTKVARVFVTNKASSGVLGGLSGADTFCSQEAAAAGYTTGSWKAILSDSNTNARDRIPFNWGHLRLINTTTPIADSWTELWGGNLQNPINLKANGIDVYSGFVYSSTKVDGSRQSSVSSTGNNCSNWTSNTDAGYFSPGNSGQVSGSWLYAGIGVSSGCTTGGALAVYCVEDAPAGVDLAPESFTFDYKLFQNTSTRIDSDTITVRGVFGVPAPVVITGSQGSPAFKINGGAEVTTGSVVNGDTLTLVMTSPSALNQSHKMEVQVGTGAVVPWRIWTGDASSGIKKRIFITSTTNSGGNLGGLGGADIICQNAAANNVNLNGMTWKAIVSGDSTQEAGWAINRIGYDWAELWTFNADGSLKNRLFAGGNIWNGSAPEAAFNLNEMSVAVTTNLQVITNTTSGGRGKNSGLNSCYGFTNTPGASSVAVGLVNDVSWISAPTGNSCWAVPYRLYCIQQ